MFQKFCLFCVVVTPSLLAAQTSNGSLQVEDANKWKTIGFRQANSMGGGEAAISKSGKFRVFVLMGQSNMHGLAQANELKPPYNQKHDRIRIWANGRLEYFVPRNRFGPGVSLAHQLADLWPDDTIGIIKVSSGGTGIRGFEKNWSFERAERTFDGKKGSLYKDLMNAVTEAKKVSKPEFSGFVWKQGGADGTKKDLADEYYDAFRQLVSDLRADLGAPDLPVLVLTYMNDQDLAKSKRPTGRRPFIKKVLMAQNRAGRDMHNVSTVHHGRLPVLEDGVHFNTDGQIKLGKMTASAVEEFYKVKP
jgi:lysophospholipase L1-like esterase